MDIVNIYTWTSAKGPSKKRVAFTFILEMETEKGPATLTKTDVLELPTENQAELKALSSALQRLKRPCMLNIYTNSVYISAGYEQDRLKKWIENDWKNAKGKPVANMEEWKELAELLGRHKFQFFTGMKHSYASWMQIETQKREKEKESCTNVLENSTRQMKSMKQQSTSEEKETEKASEC